jgi:multidrug efflux system outer membrane protein
MSSVNVRIQNILIERRNTEARLATLSGQPGADFSVESEGIQYLAPVVNPDGPSIQVLDRPDLQVANFVVEAYRKQIKTARKQRYPSLFVSGSLGLLSGNSDDLFEDESRNWLLGASLSIPLFEGGRRQALLDISEYQLENAAEQLSQNELVANQEVTQATAELQRLNEQLFNQQEFLAAADRTAALSRQRYKQGLVTYLEVVDADRIVLAAERLLVQLLGQQLLTTVDLLTALGGDMNQIK